MCIHIKYYEYRISLSRPIIRFLILSLILSSLLILYNCFKPTIRDNFFKYKYNDPYKDIDLLMNSRIKTNKVNACIVVLARNNELYQLKSSMRQFEERWNKKFNYPYVFLNDVEFSEAFINQTSSITQSETKYGNNYYYCCFFLHTYIHILHIFIIYAFLYLYFSLFPFLFFFT